MKKTLGWSGIPATATVRPALKGPMHRQRSSLNNAAEPCCAIAATALNMSRSVLIHRRIDMVLVSPQMKLQRINQGELLEHGDRRKQRLEHRLNGLNGSERVM